MQPAQAEGGGSSSNTLKKWGPIGAIVLVIAAVAGIVLVTSSDDDDGDAGADTTTAVTEAPEATDAPDTTDAPEETTPDDTEPDGGGGEITFPLSFSQAEEQGIDVAWDERCDPATGNLAIEWFFAPECYAPFEGDNGGETTRGVTADTIKVVQYQGPDDDPIINYLAEPISVDDTNAESQQTANDMLGLFEQFYELYGRTIELEFYESTGFANDPTVARADAVRIAEDFEPFVVLGGPALTNAFADELAARGVMCVACTPGQPPDWFAERDPYVYSLGISAAQSRAHATEFISKQIVGGNADFAGDEAFQAQPRSFGHVWISSSPESPVIAAAFEADLTEAGAAIVESLPYELNPATIQAQASQIIAKLKASGVSTVILVSDGIAPRDLTNEATAQEYFPEWIIAAPALSDLTAFGRTYDQTQWAHAVAIRADTAVPVTPEISGFYGLYQWFMGAEPPAKDTITLLISPYTLLAANLQAVGPNLTPETFRDALFAGGGTTPALTEPLLTYGDKGIWPDTDFNGIDDATLVWWDPTAVGPDEIRKEGTGMWAFVDGGKRYLPGEWPTENKLFDPEGAVTIYEVAPPEETPPDYPSPAG
ncbi:MAG TPA: ABC transporter substrate-binding protein [Ilumatobacteraceae bacterium]|nr:ABC transporter substrate-binding protein [Ilumatobacteraceae bacterium]